MTTGQQGRAALNADAVGVSGIVGPGANVPDCTYAVLADIAGPRCNR
ncbi:MAG: hypothetical protein GDA39_05715 [Hyphomonadaceae bacterium]|nr:hypothetical protein [Hyphomonadaceae bacterium]MBC6412402.1 hypothetical protein [Hyphomonadaceae bacterium]